MHILYIHQYFCPPGGSGNNRSFELAREWVRAGHRVTMLTTTAYFPKNIRSGQAAQKFEVEGIEVIALEVPYSHMMRFRDRVGAFIGFYKKGLAAAKAFQKPDLIYASSTPPTVGEMGRKLGKRWRIPFVFETVDVWPDVPIGMGIVQNPLLKAWLHRRVNRIYHAAAKIVALSDGMKAQILQHGIASEKVIVSYNGTSLTAFPFQTHLPNQTLTIIYTGTVGLANGVHALVDVSKLLEAAGIENVTFLVLGGGNDLQRVKDYAASRAVKSIQFLDPVPKEEVAAVLAKADVGVVTFASFPVLEANSANKFYDYLASGLPVLLNYEGWQAAYLKNWNCGKSSKMGDVQAFADNIGWLLDHPEALQAMRFNARRLAESHFDRVVIARALLVEFEQILAAKPSLNAR
jgi:glycosyltransferase involved in cell wall biosynthesis